MTPDEFMREYEAASSAHDLERTLGLIDEGAVYWFSDGASYNGHAAIGKAIQANFDAIEIEQYALHDVTWLASSSDFAACTYRFAWSGVVRGSPASGSGRGTSLLARRGEAWVVIHEHLSKGAV